MVLHINGLQNFIRNSIQFKPLKRYTYLHFVFFSPLNHLFKFILTIKGKWKIQKLIF